MYSIYYILYIIDYILYITYYMLYVIYYILYIIYYVLYIIEGLSGCCHRGAVWALPGLCPCRQCWARAHGPTGPMNKQINILFIIIINQFI